MASRRSKVYTIGAQVLATNHPFDYIGLTNASAGFTGVLGVTYRHRHTAPCDMIGLRLVFHNHQATGSSPVDVAGPNTITVKGSIEPVIGGTIYPVTFRGAVSADIIGGMDVISDIVYVPITKGQYFWTRSYVHVANTSHTYPVRFQTALSTEGYTNYLSGTDVDATVSGAISAASSQSFGPSTVVGIVSGTGANTGVVKVGDSIAAGSSDVSDTSGPISGFIDRALIAAGCGEVSIARSSSVSGDFTSGAMSMRFPLARFGQQAIVAIGINDAGGGVSLVTYQANMTSLVASLKAQGVRDIYACTLAPESTSTDSWATLANQTPGRTGGAGQAAHEALRQSYNTWLRTVPAIFTGVFDTGALVEQGGASAPTGKWIVNGSANYLTLDGLHPNPVGHALMASGITGQGLGQVQTQENSAVRDIVSVGSAGGYSAGLASRVSGTSLIWHKDDTGPGAFIETNDLLGTNVDLSSTYASVSVIFRKAGITGDIVQAATMSSGIPPGETVAKYGVVVSCPPTTTATTLTVLVRFTTSGGIVETAPNELQWTVAP